MKLRVTSVAWGDVRDEISKATVFMQNSLNEHFVDRNYGANIDTFAIAVIAVGESDENARFSKKHNKSGSDKHPVSGELVKYISIAIEFHPDEIKGINSRELVDLFIVEINNKLEAPSLKVPKGFDWNLFCADLKSALSKTAKS